MIGSKSNLDLGCRVILILADELEIDERNAARKRVRPDVNLEASRFGEDTEMSQERENNFRLKKKKTVGELELRRNKQKFN